MSLPPSITPSTPNGTREIPTQKMVATFSEDVNLAKLNFPHRQREYCYGCYEFHEPPPIWLQNGDFRLQLYSDRKFAILLHDLNFRQDGPFMRHVIGCPIRRCDLMLPTTYPEHELSVQHLQYSPAYAPMTFEEATSRNLLLRTESETIVTIHNWAFPVYTPAELQSFAQVKKRLSSNDKIPMQFPTYHCFSRDTTVFAQAHLAVWYFCHPVMQAFRWKNAPWSIPDEEFLESRLLTRDQLGKLLPQPWVRVVNGSDDPLCDRFFQYFWFRGAKFPTTAHAFQAARLQHFTKWEFKHCADEVNSSSSLDAGKAIHRVDNILKEWNCAPESWNKTRYAVMCSVQKKAKLTFMQCFKIKRTEWWIRI